MEAIVIQRFRDKDSKKVHEVDSVYKSSEARVRYLQDKGFLDKTEKNKEASLLDGNVGEVTEAVTSAISKEELEKLLQEEKNDKNRKGVVEHIEGLLAE
jgi:hypothetical protein